jgi:hypothetical protein
MATKRCEDCGRFMRLTDLMPQDDQVDVELALQCGFTQQEIDTLHPYDSPLSRFVYVQDQWECDNCQTTQWHTEGKKHYWNDTAGDYSGERPLTLEEQRQRRIEQARKQALDAGQLDLPF